MYNEEQKKSCNFPTGLLVLAGLAAAAPFFMPKRIRLVRRVMLPTTPENAYNLVVSRFGDWNPWSAPAEQHESSRTIPESRSQLESIGYYAEVRSHSMVAKERLALEVAFGKCNDSHQARTTLDSIISLDPIGTSTRVTWLVKYYMNPAPFKRYGDLCLAAVLGRDMTAGLHRLENLSLSGQPSLQSAIE